MGAGRGKTHRSVRLGLLGVSPNSLHLDPTRRGNRSICNIRNKSLEKNPLFSHSKIFSGLVRGPEVGAEGALSGTSLCCSRKYRNRKRRGEQDEEEPRCDCREDGRMMAKTNISDFPKEEKFEVHSKEEEEEEEENTTASNSIHPKQHLNLRRIHKSFTSFTLTFSIRPSHGCFFNRDVFSVSRLA